MKRGWVLWALCLPSMAPAASEVENTREHYVQQWPLQLGSEGAGAYRVQLDEAVYRTAHASNLGDVQPFNAQGQPLPAALAEVDAIVVTSELRDLPVFALPAGTEGQARDLELIAERDEAGRIRRIETRDLSRATPASTHAWLVDASALRSPMRGLLLDWDPAAAPVQAELRVEGSDDLREWYLVEPHARVLDLGNGSKRLLQRRVALDSNARYLRVAVLSGSLPGGLKGVRAELGSPAHPGELHWLVLDGHPQDRGFVYELPGRFPVSQVDVVAADNQATRWIVQSRQDADAPWVQRAGPWLAYQLGTGQAAQHSSPQSLPRYSRDRHWRLIPEGGEATTMPKLRVGYRPETLVFIAQGQAPYALAAGSAVARRVDAPLAQLVATLRQVRGPSWEPAQATLGSPPQLLAGPAALQPGPVPRDWKAWLLWTLLVMGALLVGGFAISLLRGRGAPPTA